MSSHTPWYILGRAGVELIIRSGHRVVASVATAWPADGGAANARLIAAAPEMRELLERHLAHLDQGWLRSSNDDELLLAETRALLNKIKGE